MKYEKSHDYNIKQGIEDYKNTMYDWDICLLLDHIIIVTNLITTLTLLIQQMRTHIIENYKEKKK